MLACTIWQPWASLIMVGAKPYEFRKWPAPARMVGQRIVVHAGTRGMRRDELRDILWRCLKGETALVVDIARPLLERCLDGLQLPLAAGLGTTVLGKPIPVIDLFDRPGIDPDLWGWPLTEIESWEPVVPCRGFQGFWTWPEREPE